MYICLYRQGNLYYIIVYHVCITINILKYYNHQIHTGLVTLMSRISTTQSQTCAISKHNEHACISTLHMLRINRRPVWVCSWRLVSLGAQNERGVNRAVAYLS